MSYEDLTQLVKQIREGGKLLAPEGGDPEWNKDYKYDEFVDPKFEPYTRIPEPESFDPMIEELGKAIEGLSSGHGNDDPLHGGVVLANPDLDKVDSAADILMSWTGDAAKKFKVKFLDPFSSISANQFLMLVTMKGALEAHKEVCKKAWEDILAIAQGAADKIDHARESNADDWTKPLQVAAAVAAVGGAVVATSGVGFAMIGAVAAMGTVAQPQKGEGDTVGIIGDHTDGIIESMRGSVDKLTAEINATQKRIVDAVTASTSLMYEEKDKFVSASPALAGMSGEQITTDAGLGTSN